METGTESRCQNCRICSWHSVPVSQHIPFRQGEIRICAYCNLPDLKIDRIEYPELQKAIKPDMDARSVRLDVYVKDNKNTVYDIEMQVSNTKELPERSRYYQSMIVLQLFLNANGTQNDVSRELKVFLDYVAGRKSEDSFVEKLEEAVREAKRNREWRHEYMTLLMRDRENVEKGEERLAEEKPDGSDRRKF